MSKKLKHKQIKILFDFSGVNLPNFCRLDAGIGYSWPEHRILRQISSLETGSEVPIPVWRPKNPKNKKIAERLAKTHERGSHSLSEEAPSLKAHLYAHMEVVVIKQK